MSATAGPPEYLRLLREAPATEVNIGYGGIELLALAKIGDGQKGYSGPGWKPTWLVIGHDTALGDPFFIDGGAAALPVYTAMHGVGAWNPRPVAASAADFFRGLAILADLAKGRSTPVQLEERPISAKELAEYKRRIKTELASPIPKFWTGVLGD